MSEQQVSLKFKQRTINRILPTLLVAFLLPFIIFVSVPFEIFGNNLDEFLFSVSGFMPLLALFALSSIVVVFFALLFLPNKAYRIACAVFLALAFLFFIQGTFLNSGLSTLAGDNMGTEPTPVWKIVLNLFIWLIVIAGAVVLACLKDKNGIISTVAIIVAVVVLITQLMPTLVLAVSKEGVFLEKNERLTLNSELKNPEILTDEGLTTISTTGNIYYFCVDRFDQKYAEEGYEKHSEIFNVLDGFTAYNDNISKYGHTFPGIVNLLTSKKYDTSLSREEFLNSVYAENHTLSALNENGYEINLYTQPFYAFTDASYLPKYVKNTSKATAYEVINQPQLPLSLVQIALYRCFPLIAKPIVGNVNSATCNNFVNCEGENGSKQYSTDMKSVWNNLQNNAFTTTSAKRFNFIHIEGCHGVDYDENWNKAKGKQKDDIMISLKNSFKIIGKFIDELKKQDVYDSSTIIITGDHADPVNDGANLDDIRLTALYFKRANQSGTLKKSNAQVSHDNLWSAILTDVGITPNASLGRSLFDISESETTTREYIWHTFVSTTDEYTFEIKGSGKDFKNWTQKEHKFYNKFLMD
ncbi:MAG: sulfatase-like hydrolase/transferase [Clostridia bacterium]|nr:sulfatase-like hydrolase/transferase [Clostridia bacterium]